MVETPSKVFARRLKRLRDRRGWTQDELAEMLAEVGWSQVDRVQISKIETGTRRVSLDEAVMIAWALSVPPALLYLPLGEADDVALAPEVVVHPDLARQWVIGQEPAVTSDQMVRFPGEWRVDMEVWWLHDQLKEATRAEQRAQAAIRSAEYVGEGVEAARTSHVEALQRLADALDEIRKRDLRPPEIHENTAKAMENAGVEYDGPTYPGPSRREQK